MKHGVRILSNEGPVDLDAITSGDCKTIRNTTSGRVLLPYMREPHKSRPIALITVHEQNSWVALLFETSSTSEEFSSGASGKASPFPCFSLYLFSWPYCRVLIYYCLYGHFSVMPLHLFLSTSPWIISSSARKKTLVELPWNLRGTTYKL